jgi:Tfp pilus assembly protein PilF
MDLEADLSAFVDGELAEIDAKRTMDHLDGCPHCQGFVEDLRQFAKMHKACFDHEAILDVFDGVEIFQNISSDLLKEKIQKVAELFYEIGKAYTVKGFSMKSRRPRNTRSVRHHMRSRPVALAQAKQKTGSIFSEMKDLTNVSGLSMKQLDRAKTFFRAQRSVRDGYLEVGRKFLEESLSIDPDRAEPRIFLGCYYFVVHKNEQARDQFRKVLAMSGLSEENRTEALLNMGQSLCTECRYTEAVECFKEVVSSGVIQKHPRYYFSLILLAITYAKLGNYGKSITYFDRTVRNFPKHINEIRKKLWDMSSFQNVLQSQNRFRQDLEHKIPALFAS